MVYWPLVTDVIKATAERGVLINYKTLIN